MRCLESSVGLRPGPGWSSVNEIVLTAHCHADIAGLFANPRLVAGLGQGKEHVVQDRSRLRSKGLSKKGSLEPSL